MSDATSRRLKDRMNGLLLHIEHVYAVEGDGIDALAHEHFDGVTRAPGQSDRAFRRRLVAIALRRHLGFVPQRGDR